MRLYYFVDPGGMIVITAAHGSEGAHSISWAIYHVMNRGDRREAIFEDDEDRERLSQTLTQACQKTGWQVHAYCLMRNHFHLVLETPQPNLVVGMKWLREEVDARPGPSHFGEAVQEAEAAQAERRVVEGLRRMAWTEADLSARRKAERAKVQLARELRSKTTMPLAWIAERLNMGTRGHLAWLLQGRGRGRRAAPTDQGLLEI